MKSSIKDIIIKVKDENKKKVSSLYYKATILFPFVQTIKISDNCLQFYIQDADSCHSRKAYMEIVVNSTMQEITINNIVNEIEEDECKDSGYEFFCKDPADIKTIFQKRATGFYADNLQEQVSLLNNIKTVKSFVGMLTEIMASGEPDDNTDKTSNVIKPVTRGNSEDKKSDLSKGRPLMVGKENEIYCGADNKVYFMHPNTLVIVPTTKDSSFRLINYFTLVKDLYKVIQAGEQFHIMFNDAMQAFDARNSLVEAGVI